MDVEEKYQYDKSSKRIMLPSKKMMVGLLRGLFETWKVKFSDFKLEHVMGSSHRVSIEWKHFPTSFFFFICEIWHKFLTLACPYYTFCFKTFISYVEISSFFNYSLNNFWTNNHRKSFQHNRLCLEPISNRYLKSLFNHWSLLAGSRLCFIFT